MREADIAIVGGGLAGSTAAAMLGRAGIDALVVDPHQVYPPDFRCEKLDESQVHLLRRTGLADAVLPSATCNSEVLIARRGRVVERRRNRQYNILYDTLVNTVRATIPNATQFIHGKVTSIVATSDRQTLTLANGEQICARLIILANGLNVSLRDSLGLRRQVLSAAHSISIGFDIEPVDARAFAFRSLTYYPEHAANRMAYLTLFPVGSTMRANLFVYRDMDDPWLRQMRRDGAQTLSALLPKLNAITGAFTISEDVKIRPVDLYVTTGHRQPGVVLVGDAFSTSCPAAGTGTNKVFTDIVRLCGDYVPRWLATKGMGEEKIAAFYDDPEKQACEAASAAKAYYLRSLSTDVGLSWQTRRMVRFVGQVGVGAVRKARGRLAPQMPAPLAGGGHGATGGANRAAS